MGKFFPKLTQTHVFIRTDETGGGFDCPMLPVSALAEIEDISRSLGEVHSVEEMENIRKRMIELAKTALPQEYHANLVRIDIPQLTELLGYLMYGDPDNDDRPPKADAEKK